MYLNYYNYILFIPMVLITSMLIFISNSWFSMWMIMEMNLISFISMMMFDKIMMNELNMKYFLIQAFNSYLFLMSSLMLMYNTWMMDLMILLMNISLLMKLGVIPFHLWYIKLICNMNWINLFYLSTIQKIIPFYIINFLFNLMNLNLMNLNIMVLLVSSFISALLGLNQSNIKLIIGYSSIIQMSWLLLMMMINEMLMMMYYIIYMMLMMNISLIFSKINLTSIYQLSVMKMKNKYLLLVVMLIFMSLAGVPPMMGFMMKWIFMQYMYMNISMYCMILLIFNSLISIVFYFRMLINSLLIYYSSVNMNYKLLMINKQMNLKIIWMYSLLMFMIGAYSIVL